MTDDLDPTTISPDETYEPATEAVPATAVTAPESTARGGRGRWAIAGGVVALVVVTSALAISLLTGRAANAVVLGYVPSDSIMYGEVRLDLPGDQRAAVGQFLSKFPGFADQSALEGKIDDVLDRLVGRVTNGDQAFSTDIKPWFGGELAFSVGALPDAGQLSGSEAQAMRDSRFLVLVSIKDEPAARAWFDAALSSNGATTSTESYGGATLTLVSGEAGQQGAVALLDGKVAVVGDVASVKAAVDTKGAGGFAAKPELAAALDASTGDHVGFVFVALRPILEWSSRLGGSEVPAGLSGALGDLVPDWGALALRVEGDALVMETHAAKRDTVATPEARTSVVADHVPGSAIALSISQDYGKGLLATLDAYRSDPTLKPAIDQLDQAIGILGGADAAIGWVGDIGLAITRADSGIEGGLVIVPTDRAAAERLLTSLRTFVSFGGASLGITVRDEAYGGTTITIVDLGNVADLAAQAGVPVDPLGSGALPTGRIELAYAITDQIVVIGSGPGFVKHVLDTTAATSIASEDRYETLAARAGHGPGIGFADLTAIRELLESTMANADAAERAAYERDVKPFLVPFDAVVGSSWVQGDVSRSTVIVTVR